MIYNTLQAKIGCTFLDVCTLKAHKYSVLACTILYGVSSKKLYANSSKSVQRFLLVTNTLQIKRPKTYMPFCSINILINSGLSAFCTAKKLYAQFTPNTKSHAHL